MDEQVPYPCDECTEGPSCGAEEHCSALERRALRRRMDKARAEAWEAAEHGEMSEEGGE